MLDALIWRNREASWLFRISRCVIHMNTTFIWMTHSYEGRHITPFTLSQKSTCNSIQNIQIILEILKSQLAAQFLISRHSDVIQKVWMTWEFLDGHASGYDMRSFRLSHIFSSHVIHFSYDVTQTFSKVNLPLNSNFQIIQKFRKVNSPLYFSCHVIQTFSKVNLPLNSNFQVIQKFSKVNSPLNLS